MPQPDTESSNDSHQTLHRERAAAVQRTINRLRSRALLATRLSYVALIATLAVLLLGVWFFAFAGEITAREAANARKRALDDTVQLIKELRPEVREILNQYEQTAKNLSQLASNMQEAMKPLVQATADYPAVVARTREAIQRLLDSTNKYASWADSNPELVAPDLAMALRDLRDTPEGRELLERSVRVLYELDGLIDQVDDSLHGINARSIENAEYSRANRAAAEAFHQRLMTVIDAVEAAASNFAVMPAVEERSNTTAATIARITSASMVVFVVQIMLTFYRYNARLAGHYSACADSLELVDPISPDHLQTVMTVLTSTGIDPGRIASPTTFSPQELAALLSKKE